MATGADPATRRDRRAAHIALRILTERRFGDRWRAVPYRLSDRGKPSLPTPSAHFSLSHTSGLALVALSARGPVGIDVERQRRLAISPERSRQMMQAAEALAPREALPADPQQALLQAWVRLEAVAKAEGCGIGSVLTEILRPVPATRPATSEATPAHRTTTVIDVGIGPNAYAALAATWPRTEAPPVNWLPAAPDEIAALVD